MKNKAAARALFNSSALSIPLTPSDMGQLLLREARKDHPDIEKALGLVHSGADADILDARGFSALMWAVTKGHDRLADALIASSDIPDENETG